MTLLKKSALEKQFAFLMHLIVCGPSFMFSLYSLLALIFIIMLLLLQVISGHLVYF